MVPRLHCARTVRCVVWTALASFLGGCPGPATSTDSRVPEDGDLDGEGLTIQIDTDQALPARAQAGAVQLDEIAIATSTIRALGDSAPGDETTTREGVELQWAASEEPDGFTFERAPAGRYSSVKMHVVKVGSDQAIALRGSVDVTGTIRPFEIEAELSDLSLSIAVDEMLPAGGSAEIRIVLTVALLVEPIDWANATDDGGTLVIRDGNGELAKIEAALLGAFRGD